MPAGEDADVWEPVLLLLRLEDPLPVTWLSLGAPLESAQNVLHLASLANRYKYLDVQRGYYRGVGGIHIISAATSLEPQLRPQVECIPAALKTALAPLTIYADKARSADRTRHAVPVVDKLSEFYWHCDYDTILTEAVRERLSAQPALCRAAAARLLCLRPPPHRLPLAVHAAAGEGSSAQPPDRPQQQPQPQPPQDAAGAARRVAPGSALVQLRFGPPASSSASGGDAQQQGLQQQGQVVPSDSALLWHASPVFARLIDSMGSGNAPREILMPAGEGAAVWEPVRRLLRHEDPLPVTWTNLADLLRVGSAYDIAAVRAACALFISMNASQISLGAPLESTKNVLHLPWRPWLKGSTDMCWYLSMKVVVSGGGGNTTTSTAVITAGAHLEPQLLPHVACIPAALQTALAPLTYNAYSPNASSWVATFAQPVVNKLSACARHPQYKVLVTEAVRDLMLAALLAGLKGEAPFKAPAS
ncbi:hypothetical protein HXX76_010753 [Chlamydomonas incerta]|uniref:BTB domain-containing protein n=1 Tax=Chlamydomonas incerta TaxID=51695 RepID=A0A835SLZ2_CHLIN|nr:hypothetical protein HXX76_010753 [Chlamydomonas incerta]|eukprot:KAG2429518.1 hypothetical protein HXX76_010753 [Chlamydomonas incerta]